MQEPVVPASIGRVRFDAAKSGWLWAMLAIGVVAGLPAATPATIALSIGLTVVTLCVGHSVGLHRGIIHRTYRASPAVRGVLVYLFVLTGLGGPLAWAHLHAVRDYWQNQAGACPRYFAYRHSLARDAWWNLHCRFHPSDARAEARLPAGVLDDRWLRFLDQTWPLHVLALALVIAATLGPGAAALCVCLRTAITIVGHWFVGYAAHVWGERRYVVADAQESGTNVWLLGLVSFGEGFHNNHHAFPGSARLGLRWYELDLGWGAIRVLAALGLIDQVTAARAD